MDTLIAPRAFVPPPPPKTPKSVDTRLRIMTLAAQMFIARGYSDVSMRDLASAAGLTKGAVYGHFRSKGQLLVEVIRWKISAYDETIDFAERRANPRCGVELIYHAASRDTRLLEVDAASAARHDSVVADGLRELYLERHAAIRDAMSESAIIDPDTAAWIVAVITAGVGMKESSGLPVPDAQRLNDALLAALKGLAGGKEL